MTEYIDRIQAMNIIAKGKNDNAYFGTTCKDWEVIDFLKTIPTADVIERSKIDKAIEEIKEVSFKHHFELGEYIGEETETWEVVKLDHVIDILKRNMEEQ